MNFVPLNFSYEFEIELVSNKKKNCYLNYGKISGVYRYESLSCFVKTNESGILERTS